VQFSENKLFEFSVISGQRLWRCLARACGCLSPIIFGGHEAVVRPVPIPNTAVKHSLADGSGFIDSARVGRRQFFLERPKRQLRPFLLFLEVFRQEAPRITTSL
jgi:hypothetical protein